MLETVAYLTACKQLFETGILWKKVYIKSADLSPIVSSMDEGFQFFSSWLDAKIGKGGITVCIVHNYMASLLLCTCALFFTDYSITQTNESPFLSWQTWDLLRIMYHEFRDFAATFCHDIQATLFSQFVLMAVHLSPSLARLSIPPLDISSTNYASTRAALLTRGSIGDKKHKDEYRSTPLHKQKYRSRH